jgi:hypothetical protein
LSVHDHGLTAGQIIRIVWTGWAWALLAVFIPVTLYVLATDPGDAPQSLLALVVFPLIAAGQGLFAGLAVVFGLWVHRTLFRRSRGPRA